MEQLTYSSYPFLKELGLHQVNYAALVDGKWIGTGQVKHSVNPSTGKKIAAVHFASAHDYDQALEGMVKARDGWMTTPMPLRGQIVRQIGNAFREKKEALGRLISLEMGKILSEGLGQVQQAIDICDMACGMSRQIGGLLLPSERKDHTIMEVWNPVGIVGVISAFNFPCAVFMWNAAIALICGDLVLWKNAPTASLVTIATTNIIQDVLIKNKIPSAVVTTVHGDIDVGEKMVPDHRIPLISFTGSTKIGRIIQQKVNARFGKCILELGGNNCTIIMDDANVQLAFKACTFAAVGTCGQRCTTLRRLLIHSSLYDSFVEKLAKAYGTICIGDPLDSKTLCGPLNNQISMDIYINGLEEIKKQGGKILCGGKRLERQGFFVEPTIVQIPKTAHIVNEELFCPILYVFKFDTLEEAIQINNSVPQGLSSSIFTKNIENVFRWTGPLGSDCGIVNVNMGPSGAEIGGAFGGEKQTGGGRQSGSDSWKQYMRRQTCAINFGRSLPLAQGVNFDV